MDQKRKKHKSGLYLGRFEAHERECGVKNPNPRLAIVAGVERTDEGRDWPNEFVPFGAGDGLGSPEIGS